MENEVIFDKQEVMNPDRYFGSPASHNKELIMNLKEDLFEKTCGSTLLTLIYLQHAPLNHLSINQDKKGSAIARV